MFICGSGLFGYVCIYICVCVCVCVCVCGAVVYFGMFISGLFYMFMICGSGLFGYVC